MDTRLQIGEFARLTGLSVKALRLYASQGLLSPHYTDSATGYRYYLSEQQHTANRILSLRAAGLPLADIRQLLAASSDTSDVYQHALSNLRASLERDIRLAQLRIQVVDVILSVVEQGGSAQLDYLRISIVEPEFVANQTLTASDADGSVTDAFEQLERNVARLDGRAQRAPFMQITAGDERTVCVPVRDEVIDAANAKLFGDNGLAVVCTHRGGYDTLADTEHTLRQVAQRAGLQARSETRHIYQRFGAEQQGYQLPSNVLADASARYITDIAIFLETPGS